MTILSKFQISNQEIAMFLMTNSPMEVLEKVSEVSIMILSIDLLSESLMEGRAGSENHSGPRAPIPAQGHQSCPRPKAKGRIGARGQGLVCPRAGMVL